MRRRLRSTPPGDGPLLHAVMPNWGGLGVHRTFGMRLPPLALQVVGALARRQGWRARVVDLNHEPLPAEDPDLVAVTVWTATAPQAYAVADHYRARGIPVVAGGVHASLLPTEALRHADAVVVGEAESVLQRVLEDAAKGTLGGLYEGAWGPMSEVPLASEWIDFLDGAKGWTYAPKNGLQTTRGCRFNCDFCSVIRINGRGSRHRDPDEVVEELRVIASRGQRFAGFQFAALMDDDLAADLEYTALLAEALVRARNRIALAAQASIGVTSDMELLRLLARANIRAIFTGYESVSRESLVECNKKNRPNRFAEAVARLHAHGIVADGGFIFGFDHDDEAVFDRTVEVAEAIGLDSVHFSLLTPFPGTQTFSRMAADNRITSFDWGRYDLYHSVFEPARMTAKVMEEGLWRAYRAFYRRPARARRWVRHLKTFSPAMGTGITLRNRDYARHYHGPSPARDSYLAQTADLERLVTTSRSAAEQTLSVAVSQVPVELRSRRPSPPGP